MKIRKRDPAFPIAKEGRRYEHSQPTTIAHVGVYLLYVDACNESRKDRD